MTDDQAVSFLRSRASGPNVGFITVRRIDPTTSSNDIARRSLEEARSKHLELYGNGILMNLMRAGGVVVLEFDTKSDNALKLDLVASDETGQAIVKAEMVDGELNKNVAQEILGKSENLSSDFFGAQRSDLTEILSDFRGARDASVVAPDEQGYLAIPERVSKLTTKFDELLELGGLSSGLQLWAVRHSVSCPVYAANPDAAVGLARSEQARLEGEFLNKKGSNPNLIDHLIDLNSIETHDQLLARIEQLKELSAFLDERSPIRFDSTYEANKSIATISLNLGVTKQSPSPLYATMNAAGMISIWSHSESGEFKLKGLSEGD
jgi:hypothetical protein